ncbi:hypothetical protein [Ferrovibrio sp.]|uniref:hypothetical protein n=1 Tax=Ferrovibrio sp. TaxID=1917215 RepID=UPI0035B0AE47
MARDDITQETDFYREAANDNPGPPPANAQLTPHKNERKVICPFLDTLAILPDEIELIEAHISSILDLIAANDNDLA